ncbi:MULTISPECIES: NHL repeat-containing protein [Flammeovirga]|uniref:SMP-30/Gluconolactonase/LRE-like region domain-containing protein n=1 Tax=Flammeovirga agarivorans TaxID=2726742 RepID=A0A7X8SIQ4_9BACT|nr:MULTISPECIES: hypothetical protein [Flammeovirga]NLR90999.1 hypothetical protein [Flammeovirga agarivorans]
MYRILISLFLVLGISQAVIGQSDDSKKKKSKGKKTITADPDAKLQTPQDVAFDEKSGLFYISSPGNNGVIKRGRRGGAVFAVKGLNHPRGVMIESGILYVADSNAVKGFNLKTEEKVFEQTVEGATALRSISSDGTDIFVSDKEANTVFKINIKKKDVSVLTKDVIAPAGLLYNKKLKEVLILSSQESGGGIYSCSLKDNTVELALSIPEYPYLEDITFNGSMSYYLTAWGADKKENVIIKVTDSLKREPRIIQSTADGPCGLKYIKRTNELAIANAYGDNLNIIKLGY